METKQVFDEGRWNLSDKSTKNFTPRINKYQAQPKDAYKRELICEFSVASTLARESEVIGQC